jgi:hypothetical protein
VHTKEDTHENVSDYCIMWKDTCSIWVCHLGLTSRNVEDPGGTCQKGNNRLGKGFGAPIRCIRGTSCIDTVCKLIISEELGVLETHDNVEVHSKWVDFFLQTFKSTLYQLNAFHLAFKVTLSINNENHLVVTFLFTQFFSKVAIETKFVLISL